MNDSMNFLEERIASKIGENSGKEIKVFEKSEIDAVKKDRDNHPSFRIFLRCFDTKVKEIIE